MFDVHEQKTADGRGGEQREDQRRVPAGFWRLDHCVGQRADSHHEQRLPRHIQLLRPLVARLGDVAQRKIDDR